MQAAKQQKERRDHRDLGEHTDCEDQAEQRRLAPEAEPGEGVRAKAADRDAEAGRTAGHDERVPDRHPEVALEEERAVVVEHQRGRNQRRRLIEPGFGRE